MPKTIHTPRDELVCGKLDALEDRLRELGLVELLYLVSDIRWDCERMERKLISRKEDAERATANAKFSRAEGVGCDAVLDGTKE